MSALLELRGVTVAYGGAPVVEDVSLTLGFREVAALLGANGAGKSTLLKAIMGLAPLVRGEILLHGERLNGMPSEERARRWGIAYVPEGRRIFGGMTVRENLEVGAWCDGVSRRRRLDETFFLFPQLAEKSSARAWTLSGGQQQMLAIGRALMQAPSLLLLDEPFLGLAPVLMRDVVNQIRAAAVGGPGILVAEQAFDAAASLAPRGYAMRLGRVTAQGTLAELRDSGMLAESLLPR
ncbi:MAG: ABC transporter ATP-binding protein [Alphaproteobacteria bacterium]